jgi:hypothetical protein
MKRANLSLPALALLLVAGAGPARAELLYDNGPIDPRGGGLEIAGPSVVSDPFTLWHASTLTAAQVELVVYAGSEPTALQWSIGTSPFGSDVAWGAAALANSFYRNVNSLFDLYQSTFSLGGATVRQGNYWLTLQGASSTNSVDPTWTVYWDTNSASTSARQSIAGPDDGHPAPAESFRIHGAATDAFAPEPAGVTLLGIGLAGLAGYGWRRRPPAA